MTYAEEVVDLHAGGDEDHHDAHHALPRVSALVLVRPRAVVEATVQVLLQIKNNKCQKIMNVPTVSYALVPACAKLAHFGL